MKYAHRREKGARFEREIVKDMSSLLPGVDISRTKQASGAVKADVDMPGFWIECKRGIRPSIRAALTQADRDCAEAGETKVPVAIIRDDAIKGEREAWQIGPYRGLVAMPYRSFRALVLALFADAAPGGEVTS